MIEVRKKTGLEWRCRVTLDAEGKMQFPDMPTDQGVYAFAVDGVLEYIGSATAVDGFRSRFANYRNANAEPPGHTTQMRIDMTSKIEAGYIVDVFTTADCGNEPIDYKWQLVAEFDPPRNVKGKA